MNEQTEKNIIYYVFSCQKEKESPWDGIQFEDRTAVSEATVHNINWGPYPQMRRELRQGKIGETCGVLWEHVICNQTARIFNDINPGVKVTISPHHVDQGNNLSKGADFILHERHQPLIMVDTALTRGDKKKPGINSMIQNEPIPVIILPGNDLQLSRDNIGIRPPDYLNKSITPAIQEGLFPNQTLFPFMSSNEIEKYLESIGAAISVNAGIAIKELYELSRSERPLYTIKNTDAAIDRLQHFIKKHL